MTDKLDFDYRAWLAALQESFTESVTMALADFGAGLEQDPIFDKERLRTGLETIKRKMLDSIVTNIDRLERFYTENTPIKNYGPNFELINKIETRAVLDEDYQTRVDAIFKEIQGSCEEFGQKKQQYLKYCLYDKYLDKEKKFVGVATEGDNKAESGYFDVKVQEDRIYARAKQDKEFLKDFKNYVELFENMQGELLRKIH